MTEPILSARGLSLARGRTLVWDDLSVSFGAGLTAILGPNGAGKTTLLEGLMRPGEQRQGEILLAGQVVPDALSQRDFLAQVGHMPQSWTFFGGFTALDTVRYAAWLKRIPDSVALAASELALAHVDLTTKSGVRVRRLSGGTRQRVGLAEALVHDPRVLLLDEPTVGLDPAQRHAFREFLRPLAEDRAVILSTHLTDDVEAIANRVLVVRDGTIAFDGSPTELSALGVRNVPGASAIEAGYLAVVDAAGSRAP